MSNQAHNPLPVSSPLLSWRRRTNPQPPAGAETSTSTEISRWIADLCETELICDATLLNFSPLLASIFLNFDGVVQDFVISLKMLAVKQAETTVCPYLAGAFDLRTLRAIGVILLDGFKEQLKETAVDPTVLDRLALSRDPDVDANVTVSSNDFEVYRRHSKDQPKPNSVKRK